MRDTYLSKIDTYLDRYYKSYQIDWVLLDLGIINIIILLDRYYLTDDTYLSSMRDTIYLFINSKL